MRFKFLFISVFISVQIGYAKQITIVDSLREVIRIGNDTAVAHAYIRWGEEYYMNNPDTAMVLWRTANNISRDKIRTASDQGIKEGLQGLLAASFNNMAYIYLMSGDVDEAIPYYDSAKYYLDITGDKAGLGGYYLSLGYIDQMKGNVYDALEQYASALKLFEEIEHDYGMSMSINNLGYLYNQQKDLDNAMIYYRKSLKLNKKLKDKREIGNSYQNIAFVLLDHGQLDSCLHYYRQSAVNFSAANDLIGLSSAYNSRAGVFMKLGENDSAYYYCNKALGLKRELGDKDGLCYSLIHLAQIEYGLDNIDKAFEYISEADRIANELGFVENSRDVEELKYKIYKKKGDKKLALFSYENYVDLRDSLKNDQTQKAAIRQQTKYEFEKAQLVKEQAQQEQQRKEQAELTRRNNLQFSGIFVFVLLLFVFVFMSGRFHLSQRVAEGLIFFTFLLFFEFCLVLLDPFIENWSKGEPLFKLLFNAILAGAIFPAHAFFENTLKRRLIK